MHIHVLFGASTGVLMMLYLQLRQEKIKRALKSGKEKEKRLENYIQSFQLRNSQTSKIQQVSNSYQRQMPPILLQEVMMEQSSFGNY